MAKNIVTIVNGPQGVGKTTFIRKMLEAKETVHTTAKGVPEAVGERDSLETDYIVVVEEVGPVDVEALKSIIMGDTVKYRRPYSAAPKEYRRPAMVIETNCVNPADFGEADHIQILTIQERIDNGQLAILDTVTAILTVMGLDTNDKESRDFVRTILDGGKTNHHERAANIAAYFDKEICRPAIYAIINNQFE
jgi:hypothetical protein